ncbi:DNA ation factor subunit beta [Holothuria leucospilota]|uniref:DNA ation factor subunit beta n=1 Tax=Holothuria leucospilota TaxID=206669 RepID=A0A9Q1BHF0_HOLLE|nr:DNA ation factor subunit beta [Holothuria leucospilota]
MDVTVRRVSGRPHQVKVKSFEDLKRKGSEGLKITIAMVWKMTIGNHDLNPKNYKNHLSTDKEVVFWTNLDKIMESLKVELNKSLKGNDEAHCIYNFFEMQLRGNLSDDKHDDEGWFKGLTKCDTKSEYMECKASSRIRKYYDKIADALKNINGYSDVEKVLRKFRTRLHKKKWHKALFGVTGRDADRKCDKEGKFICQGLYDKKNCPFHHTINPYRTREGRLQFQLWELDHR